MRGALRTSTAILAALAMLEEATRCATCEKPRAVRVLDSRTRRTETVTLDSHCSCPGGPAAHLRLETAR